MSSRRARFSPDFPLSPSSASFDEKTPAPSKTPMRPNSAKAQQIELPIEDSHRFRATLEEAVEKLELLGLITAENLRKKKESAAPHNAGFSPSATSHGRSKDIFNLMKKQKEFEADYSLLQQSRSQLRGLANKTKYIQNQGELKQLTMGIKDSIHTIHINLKDHPTIVGNLQRIQKERSQLTELLQSSIEELKAGYFSSLLSFTKEKSEDQQLLAEIRNRTEKTTQAVKSLEKELESEWEEFERADEGKQAKITQLTGELKYWKKVSTLTSKFEQQTEIAKAEGIARKRADRLMELKAAIQEAKALQKLDKRVNKRSVAFLNRQKEEFDAMAEQWEKKYQEDYQQITGDYEKLAEKRNSIQLALVEKQQRWEMEKSEKIALLKEQMKRDRDNEIKRQYEESAYLAACKIQFHWRVYWRRRRKELKKLKKKHFAKLRAQKKGELKSPTSGSAGGMRSPGSRGIPSGSGSAINSPR